MQNDLQPAAPYEVERLNIFEFLLDISRCLGTAARLYDVC